MLHSLLGSLILVLFLSLVSSPLLKFTHVATPSTVFLELTKDTDIFLLVIKTLSGG